MPAIGPVLGQLIQQNIRQNFMAIRGVDPAGQSNPSYFLKFCEAVGSGIAQGSPSIQFTTTDTGVSGAPPVTGSGTGVGIKVDADYMSEKMYTLARSKIIDRFGSTFHASWPPPKDNTGVWLKAITDGISQAVQSHYSSAWTLVSTHPTIYAGSGRILFGKFSGLSTDAVKGSIVSQSGGKFGGSYWLDLADTIARAYVDGIHNRSTGQVTIAGVCVPGDHQACGITNTGQGSGVAS